MKQGFSTGYVPIRLDIKDKKMLNRSKGPAVWGPRAQMDRDLYQSAMLRALQGIEKLTLEQQEVLDLVVENGCVRGIVTAQGERIEAEKVIVATGTFLRGVVHIGHRRYAAGRHIRDGFVWMRRMWIDC